MSDTGRKWSSFSTSDWTVALAMIIEVKIVTQLPQGHKLRFSLLFNSIKTEKDIDGFKLSTI